MKRETTIDWAKYFDRIFCVYYLPNKSRMPRLIEELSRTGILESSIFEWRFTTPCPYDKVIQSQYSDKRWMESLGCINGALEQLRIFKESLLLGYKRILIIEDDVAFLKDLTLLENIIKEIPPEYDVIQLDKAIGGAKKKIEWEGLKSRASINNSFVDSTGHHFGFSTANAYTQRGMELMRQLLDEKPIAIDQLDRRGTFRHAVALVNACIQVFYSSSNYNTSLKIHSVYLSAGIDYALYSLPAEYGTSKFFDPDIVGNDSAISVNKSSKRSPQHQKQSDEKESIEDVWNRFDCIYLICCEKYKDRLCDEIEELKRVDIWSKTRIHKDVPNPFIDYLNRAIVSKWNRHRDFFRCGYNHYRAITEAYYAGRETALFIEDDVRFLKDKRRIKSYMESFPEDFDVAMLDKQWWNSELLSQWDGKSFWWPFAHFYSSGAYALSRKGMKRFMDAYETDLLNKQLKNNDCYFDRRILGADMKLYAAMPNLCLQEAYDSCSTDLEIYYDLHKQHGTTLEDYNFLMPIVPRGHGYVLGGGKKREPQVKNVQRTQLHGMGCRSDELYSQPRILSNTKNPTSPKVERVTSRGFVGRTGLGMFF